MPVQHGGHHCHVISRQIKAFLKPCGKELHCTRPFPGFKWMRDSPREACEPCGHRFRYSSAFFSHHKESKYRVTKNDGKRELYLLFRQLMMRLLYLSHKLISVDNNSVTWSKFYRLSHLCSRCPPWCLSHSWMERAKLSVTSKIQFLLFTWPERTKWALSENHKSKKPQLT